MQGCSFAAAQLNKLNKLVEQACNSAARK